MEKEQQLDTLDTRQRILHVARQLMSQKGFKAVTTKEIANQAMVSEMTLFRHFGNKNAIIEEILESSYYYVPMTKVFAESIKWDLEADLLVISRTYHKWMEKNQVFHRIAFIEGHSDPELFDKLVKHPIKLKELLIKYFSDMQQRGKIIATDFEMQAVNFIWLNYGAFISRTFRGEVKVATISEDKFISSSVKLFVRALKP